MIGVLCNCDDVVPAIPLHYSKDIVGQIAKAIQVRDEVDDSKHVKYSHHDVLLVDQMVQQEDKLDITHCQLLSTLMHLIVLFEESPDWFPLKDPFFLIYAKLCRA